jgi:transposase
VSLDGTKIYANASKSKNETDDTLEEKVRDLIQEAKYIDETEDKLYGDKEDEEAEELKTKEGRTKKKHLVNTTDPDARFMKMKRGDFANGYNVQIMTEHGIVLASHLADTSADQRLLVPTVRAFKNIHGTQPKQLLADKGYSGEANYRFCEEQHIDAYIPVHQEPTDLTKYLYDTEKDTYADSTGRIFTFKQHMKRHGNNSTVYEHIDVVTKKKKFLSVTHEWQRYAREQREKLGSVLGGAIYRRRMSDVEPAFANIKHNLRFKVFQLRGFAGVTNEWNLISIAHNLKKML